MNLLLLLFLFYKRVFFLPNSKINILYENKIQNIQNKIKTNILWIENKNKKLFSHSPIAPVEYNITFVSNSTKNTNKLSENFRKFMNIKEIPNVEDAIGSPPSRY
jgi:hypothetical protein